MAIYLGSQRVTPTLTRTVEKVITITNTQDQQGNIISTSQNMTQNISGSAAIEDPDNLTADLPVVTEWTRPSEWPDLDALPELTEGMYLTYDNRSTVDYKWASFKIVMNTGSSRIALGHVNNNTWIQDTYWDVASNTVKEINYGTYNYNFIVFKITPASTNHIQQFYFQSIAQATLGTYALRQQQDQYCLERVGKLPYLIVTSGSGEAYRYSCEWIEHDNVEFGNTVTSLAAAWYRSRHLKKIEFGNWTGENCVITSLASTFEQCFQLNKLDLSQWKTTNWHVSTIQNMFLNCRQLRILQVPFDTSNWGNTSNRTITFQSAFDTCLCLEELDLSSWDTSNLVVTTLYATWSGCYHLKSLNVKNWDTRKWTVNSLYCTFNQNRFLVDVDLSNWVTSNWKVNRLGSCWANNQKRRNFHDIENWNTSNWVVVQCDSVWNGCFRVQEMNLNNWDVSNWKVNTCTSMWANCYALRHLHVSTWNTANWVNTSIGSMFSWCNCLEECEIFNWNTSNWPITSIGSCFNECWTLKEIDTTNWDTTKWALSATSGFNYFCCNCYSAKRINVSNLDLSNIILNNYGSNKTSYTSFYQNYNLESLTLPPTYAGHLHLTASYLLSRDEIVRIFNALPTALSGAQITLTAMRYKLTNADIAIATAKGYTVA